MKNKSEPPKLQDYTVKQKVLIPYELTFRVSAESPQQALEKINSAATHSKKSLPGTKKVEAKVYERGKLTLLLTKKY